jgi:uncharacterized phiE125 gp8 family phage protein
MVSTMTYSVLTPAAAEPVTLAECKAALRVDGNDLDGEIAMLIQQGRELAEQRIGGWLMPQEQRLELADWATPIRVDRGPVRSIKSISYWSGSAWVALAGSAYELGRDGVAAVVYPTGSWPALGAKWGARVRVDLNVGAVDAAAVPACAKRFVIAQAGAWLAAPDGVSDRKLEIHPHLAGLLDPLCTYA